MRRSLVAKSLGEDITLYLPVEAIERARLKRADKRKQANERKRVKRQRIIDSRSVPFESVEIQAPANPIPCETFIGARITSEKRDIIGAMRFAQTFDSVLNADRRAKQRERMRSLREARKAGKLRQYPDPKEPMERDEYPSDIKRNRAIDARQAEASKRANDMREAHRKARAFCRRYDR